MSDNTNLKVVILGEGILYLLIYMYIYNNHF